MEIVPVTTPALANAWVQMPPALYKHDPEYIRPLDIEIQTVFDPRQNDRFQKGDAARWLLKSNTGAWIGRIAAFYLKEDLEQTPIKLGSLGFFESINAEAAAQLLLQTAEDWLQARGCNAVQGPVNFGERDKWWGLLVDGFISPSYGMPYNPPYYRALLEAHGYQDYFKQFTYYTPTERPLGPLVVGRGVRVEKDPTYTFRHLKKHEIMPFAEPFRQMYNKAWENHSGIPQMTEEEAQILVKNLKPVMDPRAIWFGFYKQEPVSFFIMLPDVNQAFKYLDGQFGWWEKLKFFYLIKRKTITRLIGIVYGVVPEHQGKGIESAQVYQAAKLIQDKKKMHYTDFEMNWIGDFNPKMMKVAELMGGVILKTHITYRKMLDKSIPFERCPVMK